MSELEFLSPDLARAGEGFEPVSRSPLARALRAAKVDLDDLSALGKIEVRGELGELEVGEVVRITPERALVLCDGDETEAVRSELRRRFDHVFDMTAALAGLRVPGETLMRRLTDLDLDALPAVGPVARVPAVVIRDDDDFRLFFPQEYSDYVAEVVLDAAVGL